MPGRPVNPDTDYKMRLRMHGNYRYAATQPHIQDPETGLSVRRHVVWGELTDDLRFLPNDRYWLASKEIRQKFIFPETWDISATHDLVTSQDVPVIPDPYIDTDGSAFSGTANVSSPDDQFNNRLYGAEFLMWEIAAYKGIRKDLHLVFDGSETVVNDILTLAMFPIIEKRNYSGVAKWQAYTKTPSRHELSPAYITRFTQSITDNHRMNFLKLRIARQGEKALVACDSTTRSAYGRCLADIRWGNNKDNCELQNTLEVVVYSLTNHEPIYYRTFAGNENDARTLRTIVSDLKALDCREIMIIFDRGYETEENIESMIKAHQPFLVCGKTGQKPVFGYINEIKYDETGIPTTMDYSSKYKLYGAQFEEERTVQSRSGIQINARLKINIFMNLQERMAVIQALNEAIRNEETVISELDPQLTRSDIKTVRKQLVYHTVKLARSGDLIIEKKDDLIRKEKATAGFFSSISYLVEGDAFKQYEFYVLRDEQEKYFEEMKCQLGFNMQRNWSEDGKTGRLFILFIALIIRNEIRRVWNEKLRNKYPSSLAVIDEMRPIRYVEYDNNETHITGFTTPQVEICRAFNIPIPSQSLSANQKKAIDRQLAGRKRGRPKGSINVKAIGNDL